jgi:hypothetical protein
MYTTYHMVMIIHYDHNRQDHPTGLLGHLRQQHLGSGGRPNHGAPPDDLVAGGDE